MDRPTALRLIADLPPGRSGEFVGGELHVSPRPALPHAVATTVLGGLLVGPFHLGTGGPGGWWILVEPELHLGGEILIPDLAAWRRSRLPRVEDVAAIELAPDFVCEILSPSTARFDRIRKLPAYATAGVSHAWLVDPLARTLEVLRNDEMARWTVVAGHSSGHHRLEPFEAIELDVERLWERGAPDQA